MGKFQGKKNKHGVFFLAGPPCYFGFILLVISEISQPAVAARFS